MAVTGTKGGYEYGNPDLSDEMRNRIVMQLMRAGGGLPAAAPRYLNPNFNAPGQVDDLDRPLVPFDPNRDRLPQRPVDDILGPPIGPPPPANGSLQSSYDPIGAWGKVAQLMRAGGDPTYGGGEYAGSGDFDFYRGGGEAAPGGYPFDPSMDQSQQSPPTPGPFSGWDTPPAPDQPAGVPSSGVPSSGVPSSGVPSSGVPSSGVPASPGFGSTQGNTGVPSAVAANSVDAFGYGQTYGFGQQQAIPSPYSNFSPPVTGFNANRGVPENQFDVPNMGMIGTQLYSPVQDLENPFNAVMAPNNSWGYGYGFNLGSQPNANGSIGGGFGLQGPAGPAGGPGTPAGQSSGSTGATGAGGAAGGGGIGGDPGYGANDAPQQGVASVEIGTPVATDAMGNAIGGPQGGVW